MSKTLIIIGAGPGIALRVAALFAEASFSIGLIARTQSTLQSLLAHPSLSASPSTAYAVADSSDYPAVCHALDELSQKLGKPSVLLYHAGGLGFGVKAPSEVVTEEMEAHFRTGVVGAWKVLQWAAEGGVREGPGGKAQVLLTGGGEPNHPLPFIAGLLANKAAQRNLSFNYYEILRPQRTVCVGSDIHVATITVTGLVGEDKPKLNPKRIAETYWRVWEEGVEEKERWKREVVLRED